MNSSAQNGGLATQEHWKADTFCLVAQRDVSVRAKGGHLLAVSMNVPIQAESQSMAKLGDT